MKGQSSVLDAIIFMIIISGAVTMLIYVSGLYASSTQQQLLSTYSYEYAGNALVALHYADDDTGAPFWANLAQKRGNPSALQEYLLRNCTSVLSNVSESSPAGENFLCVEGTCFNLSSLEYSDASCSPGRQSYSYETFIEGDRVSLVLCY